MKKTLYILLLFTFSFGLAQTQSNSLQKSSEENQRISNIKHQLELISVDNIGLTENVKTEISVSNITLTNFLLAVSNIHNININVSQELGQISIANNFSNVTVADLLVYLCKEYNLTIDFTGNILSIKPYQKPKEAQKIIPIIYFPNNNTLSMDIKGDKLYDVFKRIMDESGKNLVFSPSLENKILTSYLQGMSFDSAMDNLAFANNLFVEKTKDNFYVFEDNTPVVATNQNEAKTNTSQRPIRSRRSNFYFKVLDTEQKLLEVDFVNTPIADIINDIGNELKIDVFTASPLQEAGTASLKAKSITFDHLLTKIFETQISSQVGVSNTAQNQNRNNVSQSRTKTFTFKKEGDIYFFGTDNQLS
ncbi:general secretion pathway protein GspD, partial [Olleya sp. AH-315-K02]|nr:general secretion pathway protein GspD [Olleya sp. AH-315-K02]